MSLCCAPAPTPTPTPPTPTPTPTQQPSLTPTHVRPRSRDNVQTYTPTASASPTRQQMADVIASEQNVQMLVSMGYEREAAANALIVSNNRIEVAVAVLHRAAEHDADRASTSVSPTSPSLQPISPKLKCVSLSAPQLVELMPIVSRKPVAEVSVVPESPPAYNDVEPGAAISEHQYPPPLRDDSWSPIVPSSSMAQWYFKISQTSETHGPYAEVVFIDFVRSDMIKATDLIFSPQHSMQWQSLQHVPALFKFAPLPPQLPAPLDPLGVTLDQRESFDVSPLLSPMQLKPPLPPRTKRHPADSNRAHSYSNGNSPLKRDGGGLLVAPKQRHSKSKSDQMGALVEKVIRDANLLRDHQVAEDLSRRWQREDAEEFAKQHRIELDRVAASRFDIGKFECPICFVEYSLEDVVVVQACVDMREAAHEPRHQFCRGCYLNYIRTQILDSKVPVTCAFAGCKAEMSELELNLITDDESLLRKYQEACLNKWVETNHKGEIKKHCGTVNCRGVLIVSVGEVEAQCGVCRVNWCTQCVVKWHNKLSCDEYQSWRKENESGDAKIEEFIKESGLARCPSCGNGILKTYGCNHMTCRCDTHLCYLCKCQLPANDPHAHFNDRKSACFEKLFTGKEYE